MSPKRGVDKCHFVPVPELSSLISHISLRFLCYQIQRSCRLASSESYLCFLEIVGVYIEANVFIRRSPQQLVRGLFSFFFRRDSPLCSVTNRIREITFNLNLSVLKDGFRKCLRRPQHRLPLGCEPRVQLVEAGWASQLAKVMLAMQNSKRGSHEGVYGN
jgi:hypothetical protein